MLFGHRNYGISPMELKVISKEIHNENELIFILHRTRIILQEYAFYIVGFIRDKEDSIMGMSFRNFDSDSLNVFREEKLFLMVAKEIKETYNCQDVVDMLEKENEIIKEKVYKEIEDLLLEDVIKEFLC